MNKRKHDNGEPRVEGEWEAEVRIKKNNDTTHKGMRRKVKTKKLIKLCFDADFAKRRLRQGYEVVLMDREGRDVLRLFPCMNTDFTEMFVSAQTLGDFRHKTLEGIKWHTTYHGSDRSNDEVRELNDTVRDVNSKRKFIEVTPDTVIECPNCGTEIRVGKALGNK